MVADRATFMVSTFLFLLVFAVLFFLLSHQPVVSPHRAFMEDPWNCALVSFAMTALLRFIAWRGNQQLEAARDAFMGRLGLDPERDKELVAFADVCLNHRGRESCNTRADLLKRRKTYNARVKQRVEDTFYNYRDGW